MRAIVFTATIAFASGSPALAKTADVMATLRQYIDYFNKTDLKGMAASCAWPASMLDGVPPHSWQGPRACEDWHRDVMAASKHEGATDYIVTLGEPRHIDIDDFPTPDPQKDSSLPTFTTLKGGAYFFFPGITALRHLAAHN